LKIDAYVNEVRNILRGRERKRQICGARERERERSVERERERRRETYEERYEERETEVEWRWNARDSGYFYEKHREKTVETAAHHPLLPLCHRQPLYIPNAEGVSGQNGRPTLSSRQRE
jgi:hypothetical protein